MNAFDSQDCDILQYDTVQFLERLTGRFGRVCCRNRLFSQDWRSRFRRTSGNAQLSVTKDNTAFNGPRRLIFYVSLRSKHKDIVRYSAESERTIVTRFEWKNCLILINNIYFMYIPRKCCAVNRRRCVVLSAKFQSALRSGETAVATAGSFLSLSLLGTL